MFGLKWYEKSYRRNLVDMHIEDWDERFLSQFDPVAYVKMMKKADVQTAMVYANSHVGYCNWPVVTGYMHRGLRGRDILGEVIELCHKENISVVVYYSLLFNNWAYAYDSSWRMTDAGGNVSREQNGGGGRYGVCCPNSNGYREFVKSQVIELFDRYQFEGIFYDMAFWQKVCYCDSCKERYSREEGGAIPEVVNWNDEKWIRFQKRREEWLVDFAHFATTVAKSQKPNITVEHNSAPFIWNWRSGTTYGLVNENTYIGGDLYGGIEQQSFVCKLYSSITPNKPFEYMTSRCHPNLRNHTTIKSRHLLELATYVALAHQGAFMFIDAIDPTGTLNSRVYEIMGSIFEKSKAYEPFLDGEICRDVAVFFSMDSKMNLLENDKTVNQSMENNPHFDASFGAAKTLVENHIPCTVIGKNGLDCLDDCQVLVLPDVVVLSTDEVMKIQKFVENGGSLYASGLTLSPLTSELLGAVPEGRTEEGNTYIAPAGYKCTLMPDIDERYPLSVTGTQMIVKAKYEEDVVATIKLPYTNTDDPSNFASIHSNPPGIATNYPAIIYSKYGKGKVLWVAAPIEKINIDLHQKVFIHLIRELLTKPLKFEVDGPLVVEVTMFYQSNRQRYLVNVFNKQEKAPPVPVNNVKIRIHTGTRQVSRVLLLPDETPLDFTIEGSYVEVTVPELNLFHMLAVDCGQLEGVKSV